VSDRGRARLSGSGRAAQGIRPAQSLEAREVTVVRLKRLTERGAEAERAASAERANRWAAIVQGAAGAAGHDAYPAGYLDDLRRDWPE
jgi:hypothetical protein